MKEEFVILVDNEDNEIGIMEKIEAHKKALLHRAVSVFICNSKGEWLLQRRAKTKYHSNSLWTNTCCTHPYPNETDLESAKRRLLQEMGLKCELNEIFSFIYKEKLDNKLTEYELDHVFLGTTNDIPNINLDEVMEWKYISYKDLVLDIKQNPDNYTVWFKKIVEKVNLNITNNSKVYA